MRLSTIALNNLRRRRGKAVLLVLGLAVGVATVVSMLDITQALKADTERKIDQFGANILVVPRSDDLALSYAHAIGATRAGVLDTTFAEETETDLFGEQVVLCGGLTALVQAGYETLVGAGYQPESAYFECLHELKLIVDLMYEQGISGMRFSISDTAEYGDLTRGPRVINEAVREEMGRILGEIQDGTFAKEWVEENANGRPNYKALRQAGFDHPIEKVGAQLRDMMPFVTAGKQKIQDISGG